MTTRIFCKKCWAGLLLSLSPALQAAQLPLLDNSLSALESALGWQTPIARHLRMTGPQKTTPAFDTLSRARLHFEPNRGQASQDVQFLARTLGYQLYALPREVVLSLPSENQGSSLVRMQWVGQAANQTPALEAIGKLPAHSNYYIGKDPQRWRSGVPNYEKVRYSQIYPGVDWVMYGNPRQLEYDFVVAPGVDPAVIDLALSGVDSLRLSQEGHLVASVNGQEVLHSAPVIYQWVNGERKTVEGNYVLRNTEGAIPTVGFVASSYDQQLPLVIDPIMYFTFVGGMPTDTEGDSGDGINLGGADIGYAIAVDSEGYAYITGSTSTDNSLITKSANVAKKFPVTDSVWNSTFGGGTDVFLVKLGPSGEIAYSTFFGGASFEAGYGIAVDGVGTAYITGYTQSDDLPEFQIKTRKTASSGFDTNNPDIQIVDATLEPAVTNTSYAATFTASSEEEGTYAWSLVSGTGAGGKPNSLELLMDEDSPNTATLSGTPTDGEEGIYEFVVEVTLTIPAEKVTVPPTKPTVLEVRKTFSLMVFGSAELSSPQDAFVAKLNTDGSLGYLKLLGGQKNEAGYGITVDTDGNAYVVGYTNSTNFPKAGKPKGEDTFITKVDASGNQKWSVLSGFEGNDRGQSIILGDDDALYFTGYQKGTGEDAFIGRVSKEGPSGTLKVSDTASLKGDNYERGLAIAKGSTSTDKGIASTDFYITGYTNSSSGIADKGGYQTTKKGASTSRDAFVAKYSYTANKFTKKGVTYLGGIADDVAYGIAVDSLSAVHIAGSTSSGDFPLVGEDDFSASKKDAFIARLDKDLSTLDYASFFGGSANDEARGLAIDSSDDLYMVGVTHSEKDTFPLDGVESHRDYSGGGDAFVTKLSLPLSPNNDKYRLTIHLSGGGSGIIESSPAGIACEQKNGALEKDSICSATYSTSVVELIAKPTAGSWFVGWDGKACSDASCLRKSVSLTKDDVTTVSASFSQEPTLIILLSGEGSGTVTSTPTGINCGQTAGVVNTNADCKQAFAVGTTVVLTAKPVEGFVFKGWTGDDTQSCTGLTCTVVTTDSAKEVTAQFASNPELKVQLSGDGSGKVTSTPKGITCAMEGGVPTTASVCSNEYAADTNVVLKATATAGSRFVGWKGADNCAESTVCSLRVSNALTVEATFSTEPTLSVTLSGDGSGTVTSTPKGINCSQANGVLAANADCTEAFAVGTGVTLTAKPAEGFLFDGWKGGACTGTTPTCSVITTSALINVIAAFKPDTAPKLKVQLSGDGSGKVVSTPAGITCAMENGVPTTTSVCSNEYAADTNVVLKATATAGSRFIGWKGADNCAESTVCSLRVSNALTVEATFSASPTVHVTLSGEGSGTVTSAIEGITCSQTAGVPNANTDCSEAFAVGTVVLLTAKPENGSLFKGWSGDIDKATPDDTPCPGLTCAVTATNSIKNVIAQFSSEPVLTVQLSGDGSGKVLSAPAGITCEMENGVPIADSDCNEKYATDTNVVLKATATAGSRFIGWSKGADNCADESTVCSVRVGDALTAEATFSAAPTLNVTLSGDGSGKVVSTPAGITCEMVNGVPTATCSNEYASDTNVTLTATASAGSRFIGWSKDAASCFDGLTVCTLRMSGALTAEATFSAVPTLTVALAGTGSGKVSSSPKGIDCAQNNGSPDAATNDCTEAYPVGTYVKLEAAPLQGSQFVEWQGNGTCSGTSPICYAMIAEDKQSQVVAVFEPKPIPSLKVKLSGSGTGTVESTPAGILCGTEEGTLCTASYPLDQVVVLKATPGQNAVFSGWSGADDCTNISRECAVSMSEDKAVTATFSTNTPYTLSVRFESNGSGHVISTPVGIGRDAACQAIDGETNAGADCEENYASGVMVTLFAIPELGSSFAGWGGDCSGNLASCTLTMDAAKNVITYFSNFSTNTPYALSVHLQGDGSGHVISTPVGIGRDAACQAIDGETNAGADCEENYASGVMVTLSAIPELGSSFAGWAGDAAPCGNKLASCTLSMNAAQNAVVYFSKSLLLTVGVEEGEGASGTVAVSGCSGLTCWFSFGATAYVTALPGSASNAEWSGCNGVTGESFGTGLQTCEVSMESDRSVSVTFAKVYPVSVEKTGNGSGTIEGVGAYKAGDAVTLKAIFSDTSRFTGWSGDDLCRSTDKKPLLAKFTMPEKAVVCKARFELTPAENAPDFEVEAGSLRIYQTKNSKDVPPFEKRDAKFAFTIKNHGGAAGAFRAGCYWFTTKDATDRKDAQNAGCKCPISALAKEATYTFCRGTLTLPENLKGGTYYFGVYVDDEDKVQETDEHNNLLIQQDSAINIGALQVNVGLAGSKVAGSVSSTPPGILCDGSVFNTKCSLAVFYGTGSDVKLTAKPATGFQLDKWTGCTPNPTDKTICTAKINQPGLTVTPIFSEIKK